MPERLEVGADACEAINAARSRGGRIVAVGTTVVRGLETAASGGCPCARISGETQLFIRPGYRVSRGRSTPHQFSSARVDAAHAGVRFRRLRSRHGRLRARRSLSAIASSATATRCSCTPAQRRPREVRAARNVGSRAARAARIRARRRRHAGIHAGGHLRHGKGDDARGAASDSAHEIILGNTFHLMLRPGAAVIRAHAGPAWLHELAGPDPHRFGGLSGLQSRQPPQAERRRACASARPSTAAKCSSRPEISMQVQRDLGSDIAMVFDECTPYPATEREARESMELSLRWADRSHAAYYAGPAPGTLFGIVQGGVHGSLRAASVEGLQRDRLRRLCRRGSRRRRIGRGARCAVLDARRALLPPAAAAIPDGSRAAGGHHCRGRARASTCSTASCRRVTPAMGTFSPRPASSTSATAHIEKTRARSMKPVAAIPAATTAALTCGTSIRPAKSWPRASIRSTTCSSICS